MPLPAIVAQLGAALARGGAMVAARAGASGAARTLLSASRTAAGTVGKKAAARAAARAASQVATGAAQHTAGAAASTAASTAGQAASAGGFRVLEDTGLTNARALFQAIHGQSPAAGVAAQAAQTAPAQIDPLLNAAKQIAAADSKVTAAELQKSLGIPATRAETLLNAARPTSQPMPGAAPAAAPQAAPASASPPPASAPPPVSQGNPKPQGLLDRAADAFNRAREAAQQVRERFESVQDRVKNLTMDERYQRLQKAGRLLDPGIIGRQAGTPNPSREQIVHGSEAEEERQRQQEIQQSRYQQAGQTAYSTGKKILMAGLGHIATPAPLKMATAPIWLYGVIRGFEALGRTLAETNRDLTRFDSRIADSFARLDYAQVRSRQRLAGATSGSASFLNDQLAKLVRELEPMREAVTTFLNAAGGSLVLVARTLAVIVKWHPMFVGMHKAAEAAERWFGKGEREGAQKAAKDFLRDVRDGKFKRPPAPRPGGR